MKEAGKSRSDKVGSMNKIALATQCLAVTAALMCAAPVLAQGVPGQNQSRERQGGDADPLQGGGPLQGANPQEGGGPQGAGALQGGGPLQGNGPLQGAG